VVEAVERLLQLELLFLAQAVLAVAVQVIEMQTQPTEQLILAAVAVVLVAQT
jgi:hypothetical protein